MEPVKRWGARLELAWKPVLTFGRRRDDYLSWLDIEVDPRSFFEDETRIGIAPEDPDARLIVRRSGCALELRGPFASASSLHATLEGAFYCLEPTNARVTRYRAHWSQAVEADYDETRLKLASKVLPGGLLRSGGTVTDGAYLMEATIPGAEIVFDYGIVDADELGDRIGNPNMSRLGDDLPDSVRSPRDLPPCSVYFDLAWSPHSKMGVTGGDQALDALRDIEKAITIVLMDLTESVA